MKLPLPFSLFLPYFAAFFLTCLALGCIAAPARGADRLPARPPVWPDDRYVANGCYISTLVYIDRLREAHPGIEAHPGHVRFPSGRGHTVAVVAWQGKTYFRDIYLGVAEVTGSDLQRSYDTATARWRARGGRHDYRERTAETPAARLHEIELAARLLAFLHPEILHISTPRGPRPILTWTEPDGTLALYEPTTGTAFGHTTRHPLEIAQSLFGAKSLAALP